MLSQYHYLSTVFSPFYHEYCDILLNSLRPFHHHPYFLFSSEGAFKVICAGKNSIVEAANQIEEAYKWIVKSGIRGIKAKGRRVGHIKSSNKTSGRCKFSQDLQIK